VAVLDRVNPRTRPIDISRAVLLPLAGLLWALGWLAGKTCAAVWLVIAWAWAALKLGWSDARGTPPRR
jgi:hypothetical protein